MPGLPGAATSRVRCGLCAGFQPRACSPPPPPTTRTTIKGSPRTAGARSQARLASRLRLALRPREILKAAQPSFAVPLRLDDFEMRARDFRPRAAGVEIEIALPVAHGLVAASGPRESA